MNDTLLFNGEYPLRGQIEITSPISYVLILLLVFSLALLLLSWLNYSKLKSKRLFNLVNIASIIILFLCNVLIYIHSIIQQNFIRHWAILNLPDGRISSDLVIRGFYVSKIIPRFSLVIGIVVVLSMIPVFLKKEELK